MSQLSAQVFGPAALVGAALSRPEVSLVLASVVAAGIALFASYRASQSARGRLPEPRSVRSRHVPEQRAAGLVALATIILFVTDGVLRGYILTSLDRVPWWRFTTPIAGATIGIALILALIITRGSTAARAPAFSGERRSWTSFSSGATLIGLGAVGLLLVATTLAAGIASSPDGQGRSDWLIIAIPNEGSIDPIRVPFYGWTYGVPVLIGLAALLVVAWAALDRNAARPYLATDTVTAERSARRETARSIALVATGAMLLGLAGAWRLIASAGSGSRLIIMGRNGDRPYDAAWRYADLAVAAGWCAPVLEIAGFVLLLLVVGSGLRRRAFGRATSPLPDGHRTVDATP